MSHPLILVANPGSASRKYALFEGDTELARLHFEWMEGVIFCTLNTKGTSTRTETSFTTLEDAAAHIVPVLQANQLLQHSENITHIGLRVVAPGSYFLHDHEVNEEFIRNLQTAQEHTPLHVRATLSELHSLQQQFPGTSIYGISDSAFHITKPDHAWNYGISLELADRLEIKRFGYHGLSAASAIKQVPLAEKTIVCHLGSGVSITAVINGKSKDTTMGYSPLEGVIMSTRSGSIDVSAANRLKKELQLDDEAFETYLNTESGLQGLGGSFDIRQLLSRESNGDSRASLALATYVYSIQKGIGQMAAALQGVDALIFTGTVAERSALIRKRVVSTLDYLSFSLNFTVNTTVTSPEESVSIHSLGHSRTIYVVPAQEEAEMARHVLMIASQ